MSIKQGIKIFHQHVKGIQEQIKINTGVIPVSELKTDVEYYKDAYLPNGDWRDINYEEYKKIFINDESDAKIFDTLSIGVIPETLKSLFENLKLEECETLFDVQPKFKENEILTHQINEELNQFLNQKSKNQKYKFHRITRCLPDMLSTTFHFQSTEKILYTGLHIDKSTSFTPHTAHKSDNRISINISMESRYLYFVNLTLRQVYNYVQKKDNKEKINIDNIVEKFFILYPDYPVLKIEIKPYQYYIAPTDNFIHDGTTLGNKNFDVTMVYVGMFDIY